MASKPTTIFTDRDRDILAALSFGPHTARQLLKRSCTWQQPFRTDRYMRHRLQMLEAAGWVCSWPYATTSCGTLNYYKLTMAGYRLLNGPDAPLPSPAFFRQVSPALQEHTNALTEFLVHTIVMADACGVQLQNFYPENAYRINVTGDTLAADAAFDLETDTGDVFHYVVEIDNSTERIRSRKDVDSLQRKARLYSLHQQSCYKQHRYRVLFVALKGRGRVTQFLDVAGEHSFDQNRSLFYGIHLQDYLDTNPVCEACFRDEHDRSVSLLPNVAAEKVCHFVAAPVTVC